MRRILRTLLMGGLMFLMACRPLPAERESNPPGTPHSLDFGYGTRIETDEPGADSSLRWAAQNKFDWVALDFDWNATQPAPGTWNEDSSFANAIRQAHSLGLATLVSVKNPPAWAVNATGPNAVETARLILTLGRKYSSPTAVELFPAANTRSGWNAAPSPAAYAQFFEAIQESLQTENLEIYLIAGGLSNTLTSPEDMRDVDFLEQLYAVGLRPTILGIRLENLQGNPLDVPSQNSLRHYEEIRAIMVANGHQEGLLWITGFNLPAGTQPETWLRQAAPMMKSQLYLGTVFYSPENLEAEWIDPH